MSKRVSVLLAVLLLTLAMALAGCNKKPAPESATQPPAEVAQAPAEAEPPATQEEPAGDRETTGGNLPGIAQKPDIEFMTFDGFSGKISDFSGKPTVVNMWAVW